MSSNIWYMKSPQSGLPLFTIIPTSCHAVFPQIMIFKIKTLTPDLLSLIDNKPILEETTTACIFCYLQNKVFFCACTILYVVSVPLYMHFCIHVCSHVCTYMCRSRSLTSGVFLITYQLIHWNRISCLSPQFTTSASPVHWDYPKPTLYLCRTEDLSSSLHITLT